MSALPGVRVERTANIRLTAWPVARPADRARVSARIFAALLVASACVSAALARWLPLQVSVVKVFLFAGPPHWFGLSYFLLHLHTSFGGNAYFLTGAYA